MDDVKKMQSKLTYLEKDVKTMEKRMNTFNTNSDNHQEDTLTSFQRQKWFLSNRNKDNERK